MERLKLLRVKLDELDRDHGTHIAAKVCGEEVMDGG
jgi:hypothetical protein